MRKYRCFCLTADQRIITGAFIKATSVSNALSATQDKWRHIEGAALLEVWLGSRLLYSGTLIRAVARETADRSANTP